MKIALIQLCSKLNPEANLETIEKFIQAAKAEDNEVKAAFLPEVFYSMSDGETVTPYCIEDENEHFQNMSQLAKRSGVYLLGGSAAAKEAGRVINRNYNFDPDGKLIETYDKIHLFSVNLSKTKDKTVLDEAKIYSPGSELKCIEIEEFKLGLSICFDLRFPEIYREYFKRGVNVMSISSAFTVPTGRAHWETLLRARAIENQSYVVASGQWGKHNDKIITYGHSMVVDPWGEIIADCGEQEGYAICNLDIERVKSIRARMDMSARLIT